MLNKLYGIDYDTYVCGGIGSAKIIKSGSETILFYSESKMLRALAELKENNYIGNISVFTTRIDRQKYEIEQKVRFYMHD